MYPYTNAFTGGTASASTIYNATYNAAKAFDGNATTRWASLSGDGANSWLKYDFGSGVTKELFSVIIMSYPGYTKTFKIQGSNNDTDWTDLYSGDHPSDDGVYKCDLTTTGAYRYYRLFTVSVWGGTNAASIYLFEASETLIPTTVFIGGTASASTYLDAAHDPSKAFNSSDPDTRWSNTSGATVGEWLKYDLGSGNEVEITAVNLRQYSIASCNIEDFKIQGSNNDTDWTDLLVDTLAANSDNQAFDLTTTGAYRYYRLLVVTSTATTPYNVSLYDFDGVSIVLTSGTTFLTSSCDATSSITNPSLSILSSLSVECLAESSITSPILTALTEIGLSATCSTNSTITDPSLQILTSLDVSCNAISSITNPVLIDSLLINVNCDAISSITSPDISLLTNLTASCDASFVTTDPTLIISTPLTAACTAISSTSTPILVQNQLANLTADCVAVSSITDPAFMEVVSETMPEAHMMSINNVTAKITLIEIN